MRVDDRGIGHFQNKNKKLSCPDVEIEDDIFDEMWKRLGAEIDSMFLTMLPVTPYYIAVVTNLLAIQNI